MTFCGNSNYFWNILFVKPLLTHVTTCFNMPRFKILRTSTTDVKSLQKTEKNIVNIDETNMVNHKHLLRQDITFLQYIVECFIAFVKMCMISLQLIWIFILLYWSLENTASLFKKCWFHFEGSKGQCLLRATKMGLK